MALLQAIAVVRVFAEILQNSLSPVSVADDVVSQIFQKIFICMLYEVRAIQGRDDIVVPRAKDTAAFQAIDT